MEVPKAGIANPIERQLFVKSMEITVLVVVHVGVVDESKDKSTVSTQTGLTTECKLSDSFELNK